jgi:xanthine dehydrogenase accessory factor
MIFFEKAAELSGNNIPFATATIVSAKGSTPRTSAKMIIVDKNTCFGTIGGGLAEAYVIEEAVKCLESGQSKIVKYTLDNGSAETSIAMNCGGEMEIFIEVSRPKPVILIMGGGHVGYSLAQQADRLGFIVHVAENRPEFITPERFPMAKELYFGETIEEAAGKADIDGNTYIVIATGSVDEIFEQIKNKLSEVSK